MSLPQPSVNYGDEEQRTLVALPDDARILLVRLASLGDLLLATPALRALRRRYPAARIDLLTTQSSAHLLRDSPLLDAVIPLEKYAFDYPTDILRRPDRLLTLAPFAAGLRHTRYDATLLMQHLTLPFGRLKYHMLLSVVGSRWRVGLDNGHGADLELLNVRVPDAGFGALHEAEYALALAAALDAPAITPADRRIDLADLGWRITPQTPTAAGSPPHIALHAGGGAYSLARRWPLEHYAALARTLHNETGAVFTLAGGPEEELLQTRLLGMLGYPTWMTPLAGETAPRELADRLAACDLFIGNDSLPMHLATAVGIPVVAIFGPSNHCAWGPYAPDAPEQVIVVRRDDLACSPCFYRGHSLGTPQGCPPRPCLTELGIAPVLAAAHRLLAQ
ncbi:MAG: glycosyltransferase family 9 protein [Ktedonobacterales bacterium]